MSAWTHSICDGCWEERCKMLNYGDRRPYRVKNDVERPCCFCSRPHSSGIYVREDPGVMACCHLPDEVSE